jgi:3-dehydroquinate synthase
VLNDFAFLDLLPPAVRREGLVEAVKVALIRDRSFFEFLDTSAEALRDLRHPELENAVERSGLLHLRHISTSGDPFELGSARPLDFGHWAAHKLEQLSGFSLAHGPAVAVGLALDTVYARRVGLLPEHAAERILDCLQRLGLNLWHDGLDLSDATGRPLFLAGLEEFREHLGGILTITLLRDLGQGVEVHTMDPDLVLAARDELRARFAPVPVHA